MVNYFQSVKENETTFKNNLRHIVSLISDFNVAETSTKVKI